MSVNCEKKESVRGSNKKTKQQSWQRLQSGWMVDNKTTQWRKSEREMGKGEESWGGGGGKTNDE